MRSLVVPAAVLLLAHGLSGAAPIPASATGVWTVDKAHSEVAFRLRHFVADVQGRFTDFSGAVTLDAERPERSSVTLTIEVASVNTYEPHRDAHLKEPDFFDAAKYPEIRFVSRKVTRRSDGTWEVRGDLTMKGVTKEVLLPVTFGGITRDSWERERAVFDASLTLNRQDWGLNWSKLLDEGGYVMSDEVTLYVRLEATRPTGAAAR